MAETVPFIPARAWWERLFAVIDAGDADGFVRFLTSDARFRFGNAPDVVGTEPIRAVVAGFFAAIARSRHEIERTWAGSGSALCEGHVTYTRHDGSLLRVPFVDVFDFRGELIASYRIYIDLSALVGTPAAHGDAPAVSVGPKR